MRKRLLRIVGALSLLLVGATQVIAQATYNQTIQICGAANQNGPTELGQFTGATTASGAGTLTLVFHGDFSASGEFAEVRDESNNFLGDISSGSDCSSTGTVTYNLSQADINNWAANGIIDLTIDASVATTTVNSFCVCGSPGSTSGSTAFSVDATLDYPSGLPNDIGVAEILGPEIPTCNFGDSVFVEFRNFGSNSVQSATIEWEINGVAQTSLNWTGNLSGGMADNPINLGSGYSFQEGDVIRAWTTGTFNGGTPDDSLLNDTAELVLKQGLAGVYTVDPSGNGDYLDFQEAIDDAVFYGLCDHVVFESVGVTWDQQIDLVPIPFASGSRTITLTSQSGIASNDTITYTGASGDNWILNFDNAAHYKVEDLTLVNPSGRVLVFGNNSDSNLVSDCYIMGDTANPSDNTSISTIFSDDSQDDYNTFMNNTIHGGSLVTWEGTSVNNPEIGNKFINNEFIDFYYYGIRVDFQENVEVSHNYFTSQEFLPTGFIGGMQLVNSNGAQQIIGNHIDINMDGAAANNLNAIEMAFCRGTNLNQGLLANNKIKGGTFNSSVAQAVGIIMVDCDFQNFYFNTTATINNGGLTSSFANIQGGAANEIMNNNFSTWGTATPAFTYFFDGTSPQSIFAAEHNNLYVQNGNVGQFNTVDYLTVQDWAAGTGYDASSISANPQYGSLFRLQPCNDSLNGAAIPMNDVLVDFDMQSRNTSMPDMGADEFTPVDEFAMEDAALCDGQVANLIAPLADTAIWSRDTSSISGNTVFAVLDTTNNFPAQNGGLYQVQAINSCGTAIDTFNVVAAQGPDFPIDTNFCADGTKELSANIANASFMWSTGETAETITISTAGQYALEVVDSNSCVSSDTIAVTISPEVDLEDSTIICEGSPEFLNAAISGSYNWSTGSTQQTVAIQNSGTYSVTVTDQFGCVSEDSTIATVVPIPGNIDWSADRSFLTVEFTSNAPGAVNYAWDFGDGTFSNDPNPIHIYPFVTETYTVTLTVNNPCGTATFTDTITVGPNIASISDLNNGVGFDVFPNPNDGEFTLAIASENSDDAKLEILDVQGRMVLNKQLGIISGQVTQEINLSNVDAGIYFVRITIGEETQIKRVSIF